MQIWNVGFSEELYQQARDYFLGLGRSDFLLKSKLSLCGRYCISQKMKELGYIDFLPEDGVYQCGVYTYAISHSHEQLFFAVDRKNVTVDVEKIVPRDESLLVEISDFGLGLEIWKTFYLHWTAKECVVKYLDLSLEEVGKMRVENIKVEKCKSRKVSRHCEEWSGAEGRSNLLDDTLDCHGSVPSFRNDKYNDRQYAVEVEYRGMNYTIFSWFKNGYCFSGLL